MEFCPFDLAKFDLKVTNDDKKQSNIFTRK